MKDNGLILTPKRRQIIHETTRGTYMWRVPDPKDADHEQYLGDGDGHYLMIQATYNNEAAKRKLAKEAARNGCDVGWPVFFPGHRPVDDEEWEEQRMRFEIGLEPDTQSLLLQ